MKNIIVLMMIFSSLTSFDIKSQEYYWRKGKKVQIKQEHSTAIIYEEEGIPYSSKIIKSEKKYNDKKVGNYRIVQFKTSAFDEIKKLDDKKIKSKSNGLIKESGDTVYLSHQVLFKLRSSQKLENVVEILDEFQARIEYTEYGVTFVYVPKIENVLACANLIYEEGFAEFSHPNFIIKVSGDNWGGQYYLNNTSYANCGNFDINALEAWNITTGCNNIRVAVIDDGVEDHPALNDINGNSRVLPGFTPSGTTSNGRPGANDRHGQACAGIIAASHLPEIRGIAPNVLIVPVKVRFGNIPLSEFSSAINWAWSQSGGRADILSNSWKAPTDDALEQAIQDAQDAGRGGLGSLVVFSSGNSGDDDVSETAKLAFSVGAINNADTYAKLSNGARYTNSGPSLDVVAYGGNAINSAGDCDIRTIDRIGNSGYNSGEYNNLFGGTSAAAPQVSGVAAMILSVNPGLTRQQVEDILRNTAVDLGTIGRDNTYGNGKLNAFAAVQEAVKSRGLIFNPSYGYLGYTKVSTNARVSFTGKPSCNIAPGIYFCDVYKAETILPYSTAYTWYLGDGLSSANPNDAKRNFTLQQINNQTKITTFFYHIKANSLGQELNTWAPSNPSNQGTRTYYVNPDANIIASNILNPGLHALFATNSIKLTQGFQASNGVNFSAQITSEQDDITCLPNSNQRIANNISDPSISVVTNSNFDKKESNYFEIYPNPTTGKFNLKVLGGLSGNTSIKIYNVQGDLVFEEGLKEEAQFYNLFLHKGVYFVKIKDGNNEYSKKMIFD